MSARTHRPWYTSDQLINEYKAEHLNGGDLSMQKLRAWVRVMVVNLGFITMTVYGIWNGGDPTIIGSLGLGSLALYNGLELSEIAAIAQALSELGDQE